MTVPPFDARTVLRVTDTFRQPVLTHSSRPAKVKNYTIIVPAGKSKMLVVDDRVVLGSTNSLVYLRMASSVEGVIGWPINSTSPDVGADTRRFGWLFDWTTPAFSHDHGGVSDVAVDHLSVGTQAFHAGIFPTFQDYAQDILDPTDDHAVFFRSKPGPALDVRAYDSNGMCVSDYSTDQSGTQNRRIVHLLLGPDGYQDLGVFRDGLGFYVIAYAEEAATMLYPALAFYSYPFIDGLLDLTLIPTTTPAGDETWGVGDRNLCRRNLIGADTVGWDEGGSPNHGPGFFQLISAPAPIALQDGLNSLWYDKSSVSSTPSGDNCPIEGDPTWRRITMATVGWTAVNLAADSNAHIVNVFFGPAPGRRFELSPYCYVTTSGLWQAPNRPALGFQNQSGRDAVIEVEYGVSG